VVSYGVGRVYAKVPQGMTDADVVGAANYAGLIPPMMGMPKDFRIRNRFERPPGDEDYSDRLHIVQNLYACGRYAEMMQADRKVVEGLSNV